MGPFHRVASPSQTAEDAARQERTGLMCGRTHRGGAVPSVKAYVGALPALERGVEFFTDVPPLTGTAPHLALWRQGSPGVISMTDDMVCIAVSLSKNTQ